MLIKRFFVPEDHEETSVPLEGMEEGAGRKEPTGIPWAGFCCLNPSPLPAGHGLGNSAAAPPGSWRGGGGGGPAHWRHRHVT